jgi:hypothetical protein
VAIADSRLYGALEDVGPVGDVIGTGTGNVENAHERHGATTST